MKNQLIIVVLVALLLSGCGDQVWCGENGCDATRESANTFSLPSF